MRDAAVLSQGLLESEPDAADAGKDVYEADCGGCHCCLRYSAFRGGACLPFICVFGMRAARKPYAKLGKMREKACAPLFFVNFAVKSRPDRLPRASAH